MTGGPSQSDGELPTGHWSEHPPPYTEAPRIGKAGALEELVIMLEGDLACLAQLLNRNNNWQYYVNVVGSEFPILTNLQLIEKLKQVAIIREQLCR